MESTQILLALSQNICQGVLRFEKCWRAYKMELFVGEKRLRVYYCNRIILETTADKAADWATASSAIPLEANTLGKVCLGKKLRFKASAIQKCTPSERVEKQILILLTKLPCVSSHCLLSALIKFALNNRRLFYGVIEPAEEVDRRIENELLAQFFRYSRVGDAPQFTDLRDLYELRLIRLPWHGAHEGGRELDRATYVAVLLGAHVVELDVAGD